MKLPTFVLIIVPLLWIVILGIAFTKNTASAYSPAPVGITMQAICPVFLSNPLKYGDKNGDVLLLQILLIKEGMDIPAGATGYFGAQTKAAVSEFQLKYAFQILFPLKLSAPTGAVYASTLKQLNALNCN